MSTLTQAQVESIAHFIAEHNRHLTHPYQIDNYLALHFGRLPSPSDILRISDAVKAFSPLYMGKQNTPGYIESRRIVNDILR